MIQIQSILDLWSVFPFSIIKLKNNSTSYVVRGGTCAHASRVGAAPSPAHPAPPPAAPARKAARLCTSLYCGWTLEYSLGIDPFPADPTLHHCFTQIYYYKYI